MKKLIGLALGLALVLGANSPVRAGNGQFSQQVQYARQGPGVALVDPCGADPVGFRAVPRFAPRIVAVRRVVPFVPHRGFDPRAFGHRALLRRGLFGGVFVSGF